MMGADDTRIPILMHSRSMPELARALPQTAATPTLLPAQVSSTVEFKRIWWDKHSKHPSMTQVSLWQPVPPPGYVCLGDCMVTGMYCPPSTALVLRDTDPSELVDGRPALLARPISCVAVRALAAAGTYGVKQHTCEVKWTHAHCRAVPLARCCSRGSWPCHCCVWCS
jgi:hypothetical protein